MLETDQPAGASVQCPSCNRLLVVPGADAGGDVGYPPPEEEGIEFQCVCGCTLASSEPPGTEVQCPSCGRMVVVPHDMGETQQVVAEMVAAAAAPPPPPPEPAPPPQEPAPPAGGMVEFVCVCGATLASSEPAGTEVSCPTCQRIVAVPAMGGQAAAPGAAAAGGQQNLGVYILIGVAILVLAIAGVGVTLAILLKREPTTTVTPTATPEAPATAAATTGQPQAPEQGQQTQPAKAPDSGGKAAPGQPTPKATPKQAPVQVAGDVQGAGDNVDDLAEMLSSGKPEVRDEAEDKLGDLGDGATEALRSVLLKGRDEDTRVRAARALRRVGTGNAVGALKAGLKDKSAMVRKTCARSLGGLPSEASSALSALIDCLTDADMDVRTAASDALESVGEHMEEDAGDLIETNPKKLQEAWRKWFEAGAKPDTIGADGWDKARIEKESENLHTHLHVHIDGTRHKHEHCAAEHLPDFDFGSGLAHHGPQEGNEPPSKDEEEENKEKKE